MHYLEPSVFLTIFLSAALVILLGTAYVSIYTLVKIRWLRPQMMPLGYLFWVFQAISMYVLGAAVKSEPFTQKVLFGAMVGYLIIPHVIYFLVQRTHEACET